MGTLASLRLVRTAQVCLPDASAASEDVLSVVLDDELLSDLGAAPGHRAVISLLESPRHGEPGAVRFGGKVYVAYLFFPDTGGVALGNANAARIVAYLEPGTYEVLGRVDRVCGSCESSVCRVVPRSPAPAVSALEAEAGLRAFRQSVGMLRWHTDAHGYHLPSDEMRMWISLAGGDPDAWAGWGWIDFLHPEDEGPYLFRWSEAVETEKPYLNQGRICIAGVWLYMVVSANPVRDGSGRVVKWEGFLHLELIETDMAA